MKLLLYATIFKEGRKQMKDSELQIDRKSHVLYSKPCKPEMSQGRHSNLGTVFFAVGFSVMMALDVALG